VKQLVQFRPTGSFFAHAFKAAFRQHHREAIPYLRKLIPPDGTVIDGGAHAGQFSKLYAGLAGQGHVFAFEPASYTRAVLRIGLLFSGSTNVTVIPMALSDQEGTQLLSMPIKKSGAVDFGFPIWAGNPTSPIVTSSGMTSSPLRPSTSLPKTSGLSASIS